ncbi:MAG: class I SAM-dependent methyltransferase [Streptosporangiaceae bacterium]|jgi:SAM-dependent methyltransferase
MTGNDPMDAEFDTVAEWTAEVAESLGPQYRIPAACRGSGQPLALDWLLNYLSPRPGDLMIDIGAGLGGPSAYAAEQTGVQPVLAEPEPDACRAAARLFGAPVVQADATALPFADGVASHAWCLGVLCTASGPDAQRAMLGELRRVLRPSGRAGLLVFLATRDRLDNPPEGNHFPSRAQLTVLIREAGLTEIAVADPASFPDPPAWWLERTAAVDHELRRRFGGAPALVTALEQSHRIGELLQSGEVISQVIRLHRAE